MDGYLRQSTASQIKTIGAFVDDTDFKTLKNALSIANTDIKIKKDGAASGNKNSGGATADGSGGLYHLTWDATDTATLGQLFYSIKVAGALVVFGSYTVLEEAAYDTLFATGALPASTTNITAGTITTVGTVTTYTGNTPQTGDAFARLGAPGGASVSADILAIDNFVDDLEARIGTPTNLGSGATLSANLVDIEGQTDDIGVAGAGLTNIGTIATVTNLTNLPSIPANWITAAGIATGAIDADALAADAVTEIWAGSTAPTAAAIAVAVLDVDMTAHQTQGTLGQAIGDPAADTNTIYKAVVSDATGATVGIDVVAVKADTASIQADTNDLQARVPATLVSGRMDASVGAMAADTLTASALATSAVDELVDGVWDEAIAGHLTAGSTGAALNAAGGSGDPWATAIPGAYGAGTAGKILGDNINATISSRATQASVDTVDDLIDTEVAAIKTVVDAILVDTAEIGVAGAGLTAINLPDQTMNITGDITGNLSGNVGGNVVGSVGSVATGGIAAASLATAAKQDIADHVLDRNMATGTDSGTDTTAVRTLRQAARVLRNKTTIAAGTATVTKEDDVTTSWTAAVTTTAGNPISEVNPT